MDDRWCRSACFILVLVFNIFVRSASCHAFEYTGLEATVSLNAYPGTDYTSSGTLTLREYVLNGTYGLHMYGSFSVEGESGIGEVHIHVGSDASNASSIGGHYWEPTTGIDPWIYKIEILDGTAIVDLNTTDLSPIYNFSFQRSLPVEGRTVVAHTADGSRAAAGAIVLTTLPEPMYTGLEATVELGAYPGSSFVASGLLVLREYTVRGIYGLHMKGSYSIEGENGMGGIHIHVGTNATDAATIGGHYWEPTTHPDPWEYNVKIEAGNATVDVLTTDLSPIYNFSFHGLLPVAGRTVVAHTSTGSRAAAGSIVMKTGSSSPMPTTEPANFSTQVIPLLAIFAVQISIVASLQCV